MKKQKIKLEYFEITCDQVKTDGYDGKEAVEGDVVQEPSQWSLSGALLYSVTIITTIG